MSDAATELTEDQKRTEWLGWRKLGIGASDVAALCGMSPYASPMSIYIDPSRALPVEPRTKAIHP